MTNEEFFEKVKGKKIRWNKGWGDWEFYEEDDKPVERQCIDCDNQYCLCYGN